MLISPLISFRRAAAVEVEIIHCYRYVAVAWHSVDMFLPLEQGSGWLLTPDRPGLIVPLYGWLFCSECEHSGVVLITREDLFKLENDE